MIWQGSTLESSERRADLQRLPAVVKLASVRFRSRPAQHGVDAVAEAEPRAFYMLELPMEDAGEELVGIATMPPLASIYSRHHGHTRVREEADYDLQHQRHGVRLLPHG